MKASGNPESCSRVGWIASSYSLMLRENSMLSVTSRSFSSRSRARSCSPSSMPLRLKSRSQNSSSRASSSGSAPAASLPANSLSAA